MRCDEPTITYGSAASDGGRINALDDPIVYLDALLKMGRENIEATMRKKRSQFSGFVAYMENTRLTKSAMFGELVGGRVSAGGRKRS